MEAPKGETVNSTATNEGQAVRGGARSTLEKSGRARPLVSKLVSNNLVRRMHPKRGVLSWLEMCRKVQ
jgi:hypothetical protein